MKKIRPQILGGILLLLPHLLTAQACGSVQPFSFYDDMVTEEGFVHSDVISCVTYGQEVEILIPFIAYNSISANGVQDSVEQVIITSVSNLPCGLCWAANQGVYPYQAGEQGCLLIKENTNSQPGQYTLEIALSIKLKSGAIIQTTVNSIAGNNHKVIFSLVRPNDAIPAINYTLQANISSASN